MPLQGWIPCLTLARRGWGGSAAWWAWSACLLAAAWLGTDPLLAVLWLCWSVLWGLFFASMGLDVARLNPFIGWALVLMSQVTATVPAVLGLAGTWPRAPAVAWLVAAFIASLFVLARVLARRGAAPRRASAGLPAEGGGYPGVKGAGTRKSAYSLDPS